jgi:hypothetical protein
MRPTPCASGNYPYYTGLWDPVSYPPGTLTRHPASFRPEPLILPVALAWLPLGLWDLSLRFPFFLHADPSAPGAARTEAGTREGTQIPGLPLAVDLGPVAREFPEGRSPPIFPSQRPCRLRTGGYLLPAHILLLLKSIKKILIGRWCTPCEKRSHLGVPMHAFTFIAHRGFVHLFARKYVALLDPY